MIAKISPAPLTYLHGLNLGSRIRYLTSYPKRNYCYLPIINSAAQTYLTWYLFILMIPGFFVK